MIRSLILIYFTRMKKKDNKILNIHYNPSIIKIVHKIVLLVWIKKHHQVNFKVDMTTINKIMIYRLY